MTMHHRPALETIILTVNGREQAVVAPPATRLSEVLRDHLGLTGT